MYEDDNMDFYGEEGVAVKQGQDLGVRPSEIKGLTDAITTYTMTGMSYPCLIIKETFSCPKHRMLVISNMVKSKANDKDISLYFSKNGELFKMGMLGGQQIKVAVDLIGEDYLEGFLSEGEKLSGDMLYVLFS